ncbi:hypothetical protein PALB_30410 [Pseudoalteromonas luteoviolacea B = ATCC 29581]|nr:hypothetical protein PALB_30410 [Pseudoalteromonas luteoviolacea B = ATCC 29581]
MNNNLITLFTICFLALSTSAVYAKEFVVSYDGFYDRLKVVDKGQYQFARVNFYLSDIATKEPCRIKTGKIITEKNNLPLSFTDNAQLLLPLDKQLDSDKAVIVVQPENQAHDCQLKMQIEAEHVQNSNLTQDVLLKVHNEFDDLLTSLSGFFVGKLMAFLLPSQQGIQIEFTETNLISGAVCEGKICKLPMASHWILPNDTVFKGQVVKVVPWIAK